MRVYDYFGDLRRRLQAWIKTIQAMPNDSTPKTVLVALAVCLVFSVIVSSVAIALKPLQQRNAALDRERNILEVAGLIDAGDAFEDMFRRAEIRLIDLATGEYVDSDAIDPRTYDATKAAKDPALSVSIPADQDIANLGSREKYAPVYLVREGTRLKQLILPVRGLGLYSTLYGFIALEDDANTVYGFSIYAHGETPGLGGEVDNLKWRAQWKGKALFDDNGVLRIQVVKGSVDPTRTEAIHQVDGLSGATLTSQGVTNLLRYWLGDHGFGPFLKRIRLQRGQA